MKKIFLILSTILSTMLFSQTVSTAFKEWSTITGTQNFFYKNTVRTDGTDTYIAGATKNGNGDLDILVAKYNSTGSLVWMQQYPGSAGSMDFASDIVISGSYLYLTGAVTTNTTTLLTDIITMKLNKSNGIIQWTASYDGPAGLGDAGRMLYIDAATSSVFVTGGSYNATPNTDAVTIKYNSSGTQQYVKTFNGSPNRDDVGLFIRNGSSNQIVVAGVSQQTLTTSFKNVVLTYSLSTGNTISTTTGSTVSQSSVDVICDFAIDASGTIYLAGTDNVGGQGANFYVQKIFVGSSGATVAWTYSYNANSLDDVPRSVQVDASGNVYLAGYTTHATQGRNMCVMKLNSSGVNQWTQTSTLDGDDEIADMVLDASTNIYVTGYKIAEAGDKNYYTIKYNSSGTKVWDIETERTIGLNDYATNLALDSLNNVIVTGQSESQPGVFVFLTNKYVQREIQTPVEPTPENPNNAYLYYENKGQILNGTGTGVEADVSHATMDAYPGLFFKPKTISYKLYNFDTLSTVADTTQRIDIILENGIENARAYSLEKAQGVINYFDAKLPEIVTDVQGYRRLVAPEVYPGIDAHYYSNANGLKIYYVVKPGADPRQIVWSIAGATSNTLSGTDLEIQGMNHKIVFDQPYFYQTNLAGTATSTLSTGTWTTAGTNKYTFNIPGYNNALPLLIELDHGNPSASPLVPIKNLELCTFYGGARDEGFKAIKSHAVNGRYVVTGTTNSWDAGRDFPTGGTNTSSVTTHYTYLTMVMFDSIGQRICANLYGGYADIEPTDVAINGNSTKVTVIGNTLSSNMIPPFVPFLTPGTYSNNIGPGFVLQFDQANGANYSTQSLNYLRWSTRLNGMASNMALTPDNSSLYITSSTNGSINSPDLMSKAGAYNNSTNNGMYQFQISKYTHLGVRQWATYFPANSLSAYGTNTVTYSYNNYSQGTRWEQNLRCRIDCDNYGFVIAGEAKANGLPIFNKYHRNIDSTFNGYSDCFVARFDKNDSLEFSQYIGGSGEDGYLDVKITKPNEITIVGYSQSQEYQDLTYRSSPSQYIDTVMQGGATKMLITKLDTTGQKIWSTYYGNGNSAPCLGWSVTSDAKKNIYMTGTTYGSFKIDIVNNSNLMNETSQLDLTSGTSGIGQGDGFMLTFDSLNNLIWNTYFGARYDDAGLALDFNVKKNRVMIVGISNTPHYKPYGAPGQPFPTCHPNPFSPLMWIKTEINASNGIGSLSFSNYDGYIGWWRIDQVVGIQEYFKDKSNQNLFELFPNPATDQTSIAFKNKLDGKVTIDIYSANGQLVYSDTKTNIFDRTVITLPTGHLSNGIYVVNVRNSSNFISKKLIISK